MVLRLGDWKVNVSGTEGTLHIENVDAQGIIFGYFALNGLATPFRGFWDEGSRTISFSTAPRIDVAAGGAVPWEGVLTSLSSFKGFLFSTPPQPALGQDIHWTLAGAYQVHAGIGQPGFDANSRRNTFGWFAQVTEIVA